jgi:hypothetical protein
MVAFRSAKGRTQLGVRRFSAALVFYFWLLAHRVTDSSFLFFDRSESSVPIGQQARRERTRGTLHAET